LDIHISTIIDGVANKNHKGHLSTKQQSGKQNHHLLRHRFNNILVLRQRKSTKRHYSRTATCHPTSILPNHAKNQNSPTSTGDHQANRNFDSS
jgi:transposase